MENLQLMMQLDYKAILHNLQKITHHIPLNVENHSL